MVWVDRRRWIAGGGAALLACVLCACLGSDTAGGNGPVAGRSGDVGAGNGGSDAGMRDAASGAGRGGGGGATGGDAAAGGMPAVDAAVDVQAPDAGAADASGGDAGSAPDAGRADAATAGDAGVDAGRDAGCAANTVLFVLDESASMTETWGGGTRLASVQDAVMTAVAAHADAVTVGALFFPSISCVAGFPPPAGGAVLPLTDALQIDFRPGSDFLQAYAAHNAAAGAAPIGTPLQEAFDRADVGLGGELQGAVRVVLITDGDGNCAADEALAGVPTDVPEDRVAQWGAAGIETHVVSLATMATAQLDAVATAAGTPKVQPADADALAAFLDGVLAPTCP